jgi:1-acyl-sn-glycerol-3-phosphate acyltransferase
LLYPFLKIPARIALPFYAKQIKVNQPEILHCEGPILLACNHPNAFLDAIILSTIFKKPIYSLARGDAFKSKRANKILRMMNMLPIHRLSEGSDNLHDNYRTFDSCIEIFKKGGIVLIFSEGKCVNEWKLRSLKKGTARLAFTAWQLGIDLTVIPVGLNYHSFRDFGKTVHVNFGDAMQRNTFPEMVADGIGIKSFNEKLGHLLKPLVFESENQNEIATYFSRNNNKASVGQWLSLPGKWLHYPLYFPLKKLTLKVLPDVDFYDSMLIGSLTFLYPLYLCLVAWIVFLIAGGWYWMLVFPVLPLLAWIYVKMKR